MKHLSLVSFLAIFSLVACDSKINKIPDPPPEYLKLSGGTLTGPLGVPQDSFTIGASQLVATNGNIGIGTANPASILTVNGIIESLVGGIKFPDGSVQASAASTSCFGGVCAGDTQYSGRATFTRAPTGASSNASAVLVQPTTANANDAIFSIVTAATNRFLVDAEGDTMISGGLSLLGNLTVGGSLSCTDCIASAQILNGTIDNADVKNAAITSAKLADNGVTAGSYGSASLIPVVSVDSKGLVATITTIAVGSTAPNGPAGGGLTGNYPNPTLAASSVGSSQITDASISSSDLAPQSVSAAHLIPGTNQTVLAVNAAGTVEWQNPKLQYGIKFEYVNASTVRLTPSGIDGSASVLVSDGTDLRSVKFSSALTATLTTAGAGGLDAGVETANTGYDIYLITQNLGASPALLLTISGTNPTLPAGYTYKSEALWFVSNTQGAGNLDLARFIDMGSGNCTYIINTGIRVLNDGEATSVTAINLTAAIPTAATSAVIWNIASNLDALTAIDLRFYYDAAGSSLLGTVNGLLNALAIGGAPNRRERLVIPIHNGLTASLFYSFSGSPLIGDFGLSTYVQGWTLPSRMAR